MHRPSKLCAPHMASEEEKYKIPDLDEYIRQGEPPVRERGKAWQTAIGLQQVDGLQTSDYLLDTARRHIEGDITIVEAKNLIDTYYKSAGERRQTEDRTEEADKVSARIAEILAEDSFTFSPAQLASIHRRLFDGIYKMAGTFRNYNISKKEWVLGGETVIYASYDTIGATLDYDMGTERNFSYANMNVDESIRHLARFCANLWQIHPFCEGNTRTSAVFLIKYLRTLGLRVVNDVFAENSWYFRNALVRANFNDLQKGVTETTVYLENFLRNMLLGERNALRNRELHVEWKESAAADVPAQSAFQSAKLGDELPPKCKFCTLEELAVLRIIRETPNATQKMIAEAIGKSERKVKTLTILLQEKGIIRRINGKRNGLWEIIDE